MAQVGWVYLDDFGGRHRIGLYHGDRAGHLLLHCDARIVQVDFSVKESRIYSFFVEDELCEVYVYKEKEGFSYDFQVNKTVDTPRNRLRKADERRNRKYMAILVTGLVLVVSCVFFGLRWYNHRQAEKRIAGTGLTSRLTPENEQRLRAEGRSAVARLVLVEVALSRQIFYGFTTEANDQVSGRFYVPDTGQIILPNGFPLHDRDAFAVHYLPSEPQIHRVDFDLPTDQTLAVYLEEARLAEVQAHPSATAGHGLCVAKLTLRHKGWRRLADLIFQTALPHQNLHNNRESYQRLLRDPEFANLLARECWDQ